MHGSGRYAARSEATAQLSLVSNAIGMKDGSAGAAYLDVSIRRAAWGTALMGSKPMPREQRGVRASPRPLRKIPPRDGRPEFANPLPLRRRHRPRNDQQRG